jgi:alpha-amylase
MLMKNYRLSDDVAFRFGNRAWAEWPLTTEKFAGWVDQINGNGYVCNLFMDYETFGEHHWKDTGILDFLAHMPSQAHKHPNLSFSTITEAAESLETCDTLSVPSEISWADAERNTSTWLGNRIQRACFSELESLLPRLRKANDPRLWEAYRRLQTSDHLMYLSTKGMSDREVHNYFSPYKDSGPYDNFISFMNIITDFKSQVDSRIAKGHDAQRETQSAGPSAIEKERLIA